MKDDKFKILASCMDDLFHIGEKYIFNGQKLKEIKIEAHKGKIVIEEVK